MTSDGGSPQNPPARPPVSGARTDVVVEWIFTLVGMTGIVAVLLILVFVAKEALPLFFDARQSGEASLGKLFLPQPWREGRGLAYLWQPVGKVPKVSLVPLILGTFKVTVVALLAAVPVGVAAALFSSEFAPRWVKGWLKPTVELLAGIPSVVLGFFALMTMATVLQDLLGLPTRLNSLVAGLAMAVAIVPIIFTVSEDALTAVPRSYREASLALGATPWETAWKVVLPAAAPGVLSACVLGFGRAIGETMIVLMASGNAALVSASLSDSTRTLSATIAAEMGEVVVGSTHYSLLFLLGVILFLFNAALNATAGAWVRAWVERRQGSSS